MTLNHQQFSRCDNATGGGCKLEHLVDPALEVGKRYKVKHLVAGKAKSFTAVYSGPTSTLMLPDPDKKYHSIYQDVPGFVSEKNTLVTFKHSFVKDNGTSVMAKRGHIVSAVEI